MTGATAPTNLDGTDLSPVLFQDQSLARRDLYWIWNSEPNRRSLRYGDWKIVHYGKSTPKLPSDWELFNLHADPEEQTNVTREHPEITGQLHKLYLKESAKDSPDSLVNPPDNSTE